MAKHMLSQKVHAAQEHRVHRVKLQKPAYQTKYRMCPCTSMTRYIATQAKALISTFEGNPNKYSTFNLISYKDMLDPVLLQFIQQVTNSVRGRRRKLFQDEFNDTNHTKLLVRHLFLLSSLLFFTNPQCSMPFHILLTEAIQCHGGTQELIKILNRVGAVASIDTNQRLATQVV